MDKGHNYVSILMKTMGIKDVVELKVDGTGRTQEERAEAIEKAESKINKIISDLIF